MKRASLIVSSIAVLLSVQLLVAAAQLDEPEQFFKTLPGVPRVEDVEQVQDTEIYYRLPNDTAPETFDITITTRVDEAIFAFQGIARIGIVVRSPTSAITLHHRQLVIESVRVLNSANQDVELNAFTYVPETEFLIIPTRNPLTNGQRYTVIINYSGELRTDNRGFYRSSYVENNQRR